VQTLAFKGDRGMVSDVDIDIERAVRSYLERETPGIGFLGEEEGQSSDGTILRWLLTRLTGPPTSSLAFRSSPSL
jgi:myo-inositol-1(or 4)-monophosphatase